MSVTNRTKLYMGIKKDIESGLDLINSDISVAINDAQNDLQRLFNLPKEGDVLEDNAPDLFNAIEDFLDPRIGIDLLNDVLDEFYETRNDEDDKLETQYGITSFTKYLV